MTEGTNAGEYEATFTPKGDYVWSDGTQDARTVTWTIKRKTVQLPAQSGSLTYTGSAQSPTWDNYSAVELDMGGTTSGTNAGSYQATFTPTSNFQWSDGTYGAKNATWSIAKAAGSLSINPTTMTLDVSTLQKTIAVTRAGNGVISVSVDNTAIAEASLSGTTITVTGKAKGTAKITVSVAAGTNHTAPASAVCTATVSLPSKTLADNDPATIQARGRSWHRGQLLGGRRQIGIAVNGTFGGLTLNQTVYAFILGFNHNQSVEGNGIDFQFGKTADGRDIAFVQSYGSTGSGFCMNTSNTNSGGWKNSHMMKTICPAFLNALPAAWRNAIKNCTKYSDNTGGGNDTASYVTATTQKIFLLAEFEVHGTRYYANNAEKNYQKQYELLQKRQQPRSSTSTAAPAPPAIGGCARSMRATRRTSALCPRSGARATAAPTIRMASRRALRPPNPKNPTPSEAVGAKAPASGTQTNAREREITPCPFTNPAGRTHPPSSSQTPGNCAG